MRELRVAWIQTALYWKDRTKNLAHFEHQLQSINQTVDILVLPEMFTTGFSMDVEALAEPMNGPTMHWMHTQAQKHQLIIVGSIIIKEKDHYYNRLLWMRPNGSYAQYDKRHLFGLAKEDEVFAQGTERLIVHYKGWKICPLICYDLRFPVWARNDVDYDVLFYVANWPQKRIAHWRHLLLARAIENQVYVLGVNRIGDDGNGYAHNGQSLCVHPNGKVLTDSQDEEGIFIETFSKDALQQTRQYLPFLKDRDHFRVILDADERIDIENLH